MKSALRMSDSGDLSDIPPLSCCVLQHSCAAARTGRTSSGERAGVMGTPLPGENDKKPGVQCGRRAASLWESTSTILPCRSALVNNCDIWRVASV